MGTRGPKSGAELAIIGPSGIVAATPRPAPPPDLTGEAAEAFVAIVNGNPAALIGPGSVPLLAQLCRHVVAARRVAGWLARIEGEDGELDADLWLRLLARQEAESKVIAALATRLRLTPQSRYTAHGAATAARKARTGPAPWEASDLARREGGQSD
ncbi:MAG: hypothetical protein IOD05_01975 [Rhodobacter sp.]|nr:hypothetical protein [Rhodobacter sp.]MCA3492817.1 hypothetical protein [Rhodobacter sp.]MCA3500475.1 hypothetical protein [Rhodobacter sp.]MCA3502035.1 hypothetical protein [Rhodobacter sp.]MCA3518145.1 hypothetical protein [Rhodobacter sp.]